MNKRNIVVSGVGAVVTLAAAGAILAAAIFGHVNLNGVAFALMAALFAVGFALGFASWLLGLMNTARLARWDWFIAVLLLGMPGALLYGIGGPSGSAYTLFSARSRPRGTYAAR